MAILPRYQRIGLQTRQPQQIDFASSREQAGLGQNISQQINRMSDFAFREASAQAETRGQERVRDEGALPTLESIEAGGGPSTIAERSAYALGSRVAVAEIQNTAEIEIMRILSEAETNETPFSVVQNSLLEATDGYSESLRVIDPAAASVLKVNLQGASAKATERYSNYYVKLQASKQATKVSNALELQSNNVVQAAILPGATLETINSDIKAASKLLVGLAATDSQIDLFREQTLNEAVRENTIYKFNTTDLNGQLEMITLMETIPVEGMDLEQTQKFRSFLKARYNEGLSVVRAQVKDLGSQVMEQYEIAAGGGTPDPDIINRLRTQTVTIGVHAADVRTSILKLQRNLDTAKTYRKMSLEDLTLEVQSLRDGMPGVGGAGMDTLIETEAFGIADAYLDAANKSADAESAAEKAKYKPIIESLKYNTGVLQQKLENGLEVTQEDYAAIADDFKKIPGYLKGSELLDAVSTLGLTLNLSADLENMNPQEVKEYIQDILRDPSKFDINTEAELNALKFAETFQTNMEASIKDDPLAYAKKVGMSDASGNVINITPIDWAPVQLDPRLKDADNRYSVFQAPLADNTVASIKERISAANVVADRYGTPPRYFTNEEIDTYSQYLLTADKAQQMFLLGSLAEGGGIATPDMLAEISKNAPQFAVAGMLVVQGNMAGATSLLSGLEYLNAGNKVMEFTPTNTDLIFKKATSLALLYMPETEGLVRLAAEAIYADKAKLKESFDADIWEQSINTALGGVGDRGGIQSVRGIPVLLPPSLTSAQVSTALKNVTVQSLMAASGGQIVDPELVEAFSGRGWFTNDNNYTIVSNGGNQYVAIYGDPTKPNPLYLSDTSGNPVFFDLLELIEANKITPAPVPIGGQTPEEMGFFPDEEVVRPEGSVSPAAQEASSTMDKIINRVQEAQALEPTMPVVSPEALSASRESAAAMAKATKLAQEAKRKVTRQHPKYSEFSEAMKSPRYKKILETPDKEEAVFYQWLENMGYNQ